MIRPPLEDIKTLAEFKQWYWYKKELYAYCRKNGLPTTGGKLDLTRYIEYFLYNGKNAKGIQDIRVQKRQPVSAKTQLEPKDLNEKIPANFTSSELYRAYFKKVVGSHFHFTAYMMKYLRENPDITFKQYIDEWNAEYNRRKDKSYKPEIMKSTQYNQYMRDFFADPINKGRTVKDAIVCWNKKRNISGAKRTYEQEDLLALAKK